MNTIIWHKWVDPLYPLVKGFTPEEDEHDQALRDARKSFTDDDDEGEDEEDTPTNYAVRTQEDKNVRWGGPAIVGPAGIVPLRESNIPSTLYNFWMGHSNFDLTENMVQAIEDVPGVESLDVFTRYRFRLAIGRAFDENLVKAAIDEAVKSTPTPSPAEPIENIKHMLAARFPYWAIAIFSDGTHKYVGGATVDEVNKGLQSFGMVAEKTILSWGSK